MNQTQPAPVPSLISDIPAPDLSVVIVSYNTRGLLADCLRSLLEGGLAERSAEVWVVDNDSRDGSADMVREQFPSIRLIENRENVGFARANNQAIRQACGRYFLLLNSDTIVPPGALAALVGVMDEHPEAAVCAPLLLNADGSPQINWARFPGLQSELSGELDRSQSPYPLGDFDDSERRSRMEPFTVDWASGACFLVRASDVATVGLLDEGYFMYSEETEWCLRFGRAGRQVLLVPSVAVTHLWGQSCITVPLATRRRLFRSSVRFYRQRLGLIGSVAPSGIALARYLLFPLKHRRKIQGQG